MSKLQPIRAHSIIITAGADTQEGLIAELQQIILDLRRGLTNSVSGSPSTNHIVTYIVDEAMTHERYMEHLDEYLAEQRGNPNP